MNTAEQREVAKPSLKSVLRTAQKPETVTKSKTPTIPVDDATKELAQKVKDAKQKLDSAQTMLDLLSAELIEKVAPTRISMCQKEYHSSLRVPTEDNLSVVIVWSGNYIKIPPSSEDMLIEILGDKYADYFKSKFVISATDKTDAELYELFAWLSPDDGATEEGLAIGQQRFGKFFSVDEVIKPTENFVRAHVLMDQDTKDALQTAGVKQYKPSVKTR